MDKFRTEMAGGARGEGVKGEMRIQREGEPGWEGVDLWISRNRKRTGVASLAFSEVQPILFFHLLPKVLLRHRNSVASH